MKESMDPISNKTEQVKPPRFSEESARNFLEQTAGFLEKSNAIWEYIQEIGSLYPSLMDAYPQLKKGPEKIDTSKYPRDAAKNFMDAYYATDKPSPALVQYAQTIIGQYPEFEQKPVIEEKNRYEQFQEDQQKLADVFANSAQGFNADAAKPALEMPDPVSGVTIPENVNKSINDTAPHSLDAVATAAMTIPGIVGGAPETAGSVRSMDNTVSAAIQTEDAVMHAGRIAEMMKRHPSLMKPEDWEFERDPQNRQLIDNAMNERFPTGSRAHPEGEPIGLDESRKNLNDTLAQVGSNPTSKTQQERLSQAEKTYQGNHIDAYGKTYESKGRRAALVFALKEEALALHESMKRLTSAQEERLNKTLGAIAGVGLALGILAGAGISKVIQKIKERPTSITWRNALQQFKRDIKKERQPITLKNFLFNNAPTEKDKKAEEQDAKKLQEESKQKITVSNKEETAKIEKEKKQLEEKKTMFIEGAFGKKLKGEQLKYWEKIKKFQAVWFMEPQKGEWKDKNGAPMKITVDNYFEEGTNLRTKLLDVYNNLVPESERTTDNKMTLEELINRAVKEEKVGTANESSWINNQPSSSTS